MTSKKKRKKSTPEYIVALIGAFATLVAAIIAGFFGLATATANWEQKAKDNNWIPKDSWIKLARENNWIPSNECYYAWEKYTGKGNDQNSRSIGIRINILSEEYKWEYNRSDRVELGGHNEDLRPHLSSLDASTSKAIVCVGTASVEGERIEQARLAYDRSERLLALIREELKPKVPLYGLNLGRAKFGEFVQSNQLKNAQQRRIIVVEIIEQEENVDLKEALFNALILARETKPPIPFDVREYFEFEFYKARQ